MHKMYSISWGENHFHMNDQMESNQKICIDTPAFFFYSNWSSFCNSLATHPSLTSTHLTHLQHNIQ